MTTPYTNSNGQSINTRPYNFSYILLKSLCHWSPDVKPGGPSFLRHLSWSLLPLIAPFFTCLDHTLFIPLDRSLLILPWSYFLHFLDHTREKGRWVLQGWRKHQEMAGREKIYCENVSHSSIDLFLVFFSVQWFWWIFDCDEPRLMCMQHCPWKVSDIYLRARRRLGVVGLAAGAMVSVRLALGRRRDVISSFSKERATG